MEISAGRRFLLDGYCANRTLCTYYMRKYIKHPSINIACHVFGPIIGESVRWMIRQFAEEQTNYS